MENLDIVFVLVFGSVGGFLSAFHITYHDILVMICYLVLSVYFSFLKAGHFCNLSKT